MRRITYLILLVTLLALVFDGPMLAQAQFPEVIPLPFKPEGVAIPFGTNIYVSSMGDGAIWRGDVRIGTGQVLVQPPAEPRFALGLSYDPRTNYLFVAAAFVANGVPNTDLARVYDATTGALVRSYPFPPQSAACPGIDHPWGFHVYHFANDVIVTQDGAYISDSVNPCIYKLPLGPAGRLPDAAVEIVLQPGLPNGGFWPGFIPNGIEATPEGKSLILADSIGRLYRIDPTNGAWSQVSLGGVSLPGTDGILLINQTLYVAQSMFNNDLVEESGGAPLAQDQISVVELDPWMQTGRVVRTIRSGLLCRPATVAAFGPYLYVANAAIDGVQGMTKSDADCLGEYHEVVRLPRY